MKFQDLKTAERFYLPGSDILYERIKPTQVGPQVFSTAVVRPEDEVKVWGDDAGPDRHRRLGVTRPGAACRPYGPLPNFSHWRCSIFVQVNRMEFG